MYTSEIRIPENDLRYSLFVRRGTLPIVLTVPHDGFLEKVGQTHLVKDEVLSPSPRDEAVRVVARDIYTHVWNKIDQVPSLVICLVKRKFRTIQTQRYFEQAAINLLKSTAISNPGKRILHIDLHGFKEQPEIGDYDLIFGTDHRKSVGSSADIELANFMINRGYKVYLPTEEVRAGERYGAGGEIGEDKISPLVQEVLATQMTQVDSIQIETARRFRQRGAETEGKKLSRDLGNFFIYYKSI